MLMESPLTLTRFLFLNALGQRLTFPFPFVDHQPIATARAGGGMVLAMKTTSRTVETRTRSDRRSASSSMRRVTAELFAIDFLSRAPMIWHTGYNLGQQVSLLCLALSGSVLDGGHDRWTDSNRTTDRLNPGALAMS